jgi:hypothetical protein
MLPSHSSHVTLVTLRSIERIYCLPQRCSRQLPRSHLATPGPPHPTPPFTMAMLLKKAGVAAPARVSGPCLLWLSCVCTLKWWLRARARWQLPRGACVPRCWGENWPSRYLSLAPAPGAGAARQAVAVHSGYSICAPHDQHAMHAVAALARSDLCRRVSLVGSPCRPVCRPQTSVRAKAAIEWYGPDRPKFLGECAARCCGRILGMHLGVMG